MIKGSSAETIDGICVWAGATIKSTMARVEEEEAASIIASKTVIAGVNVFRKEVTRVLHLGMAGSTV